MRMVLCLTFLLTAIALADIIPLTIRERAGVSRSQDPVTFGIPFPVAAQFFNTSTMGVFNGSGAPVPAQFRVTSRWGGTPNDATKPIRWMLVDIQADVAANSTASYSLRTDVSTQAGSGISVTETSSAMTVNTGSASFMLSKSSFNLFDQVIVGGDTVVKSGASDGAVVKNGATAYRARDNAATLSVEEQGMLRTVVLARGSHGTHSAYTARLVFYANKSFARVFYRLENNRNARASGEGQPMGLHDFGGDSSVSFTDMGLQVKLNGASGLQYMAQGQNTPLAGPLAGDLSLYQESSGLSNWNAHVGNGDRISAQVTFRGYRIRHNGTQLEAGNFGLGWTSVSNGSACIMAGCRDFWQNYPKAVRAHTDGSVDVSLFPDEFPASFNFRPGEYKTHETYFSFHAGAPLASELEAIAKSINEPLFCTAPATWYIQSQAIQDFSEFRRSASVGDKQDTLFERTIYTIVDSNIGSEAHWVNEVPYSLLYSMDRNGMYGFQDFGDMPVDFECGRGQYGLKYNAGFGFLVQFLRTGDYRFWELGENGERHEGDMDIVHTGRAAHSNWWDHSYFGHSYHDECGDDNPHRNYGGGNPDILFGAQGLFLYHALTGYAWAFEYGKEIADNAVWKATDGCCFDRDGLRSETNMIRSLVEGYRATGNTLYRDKALELIQYSFTHIGFTGDISFSMSDFLKAVGLYIQHEELVSGTQQTALRQALLARLDTCRTRHTVFDDHTTYAAIDENSDWNRQTADAFAYGYKFSGDTSLLSFAHRLLNTAIFWQSVGVGCEPGVWGANLITGPSGSGCSIIHYFSAKEAANASLQGLVYMAMKHPVDPYVAGTEHFPDRTSCAIICRPNPFNPMVRIAVKGVLPAAEAKPEICIYDIRGAVVYRKVVSVPQLQTGLVWDARTAASGVYCVKVLTGRSMLVRTVTLLK